MKIFINVLLISNLIFPIQTFGECEKPVIALKQGEVASCSGYLFSKEQEQEVRVMKEDYKLLQQKLILKEKQIDLFKKDASDIDFIVQKERDKAELWRKTAEDSTKQLIEIKEVQGKRDWLMILAGIALTVGSGFAIGAASNHR